VRKPRRWCRYPDARDQLRLPPVADHYARTLLDATAIAGGEVLGTQDVRAAQTWISGRRRDPELRECLPEFTGARTISAIAEIAPARAF
jgi:hypothetical protein